jgi:predicted nucleic acid-binding protein
MTTAYVDTNVLIRYLTADDPRRSPAAAALLAEAASGGMQLILTETTLAEVVWVLQGVYGHGREQIADGLRDLIVSDGIVGLDVETCATALDIYRSQPLDFTDALLAARALVRGPRVICSFDRDFDRVRGIERLEPGRAVR